jgi:hypothetical protein
VKDITTVKIGERNFLTGKYSDGSFGGYTRMLSAFEVLVDAGTYVLQMGEGTQYALKGRERYECNLRQRVAKRLREQLHEIERKQNKGINRRYVHWSNSMGRPVDDGE